MIEVEEKFIFDKGSEKKVIQGANFLGEKLLIDTYYDTKDYALTTKDTWLRNRNGNFELKVPLNEGKGINDRIVDRYDELETAEEIRKALSIPMERTLKEDLKMKGYYPFATLVTTRRKYKKGDFNIDLDIVDFGYKIIEIELMVKDSLEMKQAVERINFFAKEKGLISRIERIIRGKLIEYIYRNDSKHYLALIEAGVV
jgi:thiamine-triphosphatase